MFDSTGKDAVGRGGAGSSRSRLKAGRRLQVEALDARQLLTASLATISNVSSPQYLGTVVPLNGGTGNTNQTYTVTSDVPGVKASVVQGKFLTLTVTHSTNGVQDINGSLTFQLFDQLTPVTTAKIESLINGNATGTTSAVTAGQNFYNGKNFFRVASGFPTDSTYIVQGASSTLTASGAATAFTTPFDDEFIQSLAFTGTGQLAMANAGPDTNDSQFFITTGSPRALDHKHTIWGQLVSGQDVLNQITQVAKTSSGNGVDASASQPVDAVTIGTATLSDTNPNGVLQIDTTNAPVGATANVTVTATDPTDNTTATRTFQVGVAAVGQTNERPYLGPVDSAISVGSGQAATFQLSAVNPDPTTPLVYVAKGGLNTAGTAFTDVSNGTATVSSTGLVTVTPTSGFTGTISVLVGVRAGTAATTETPSNFDTQKLTITVNSSTTAVSLRPIAESSYLTVPTGRSSTLQLSGRSPNTGAPAVTFAILTQPTNGTITNFNATTGTYTYTPTAGYAGPDSFTFESQSGNDNQVSFPATVRFNVTNASTGAVRYIDDDGGNDTTKTGFLFVTPPPRRKGTNIITVGLSGENIQVIVNGVVDAIQPAESNVNRIVVYGSKANDRITIDPAITALATIDGGHGGRNNLQAGSGDSTLHGWFGQNTMRGGAGDDTLIGRRGHVQFRKSAGTDILFAGTPRVLAQNTRDKSLPTPETGTFYRFKGNKLVETTSPYGKPTITRSLVKAHHITTKKA